MNLPEPQTRTFASLVGEIEKGQIKIPQFQRDFVWTMQKSAGLIDSIIKAIRSAPSSFGGLEKDFDQSKT